MGTRDRKCEEQAERTAEFLGSELWIHEGPHVGVILGTGWGDALRFEDERSIPLAPTREHPRGVPGFWRLGQLAGHARKVICGRVAGKRVLALSGRIHMNEGSTDAHRDMVRLQVEMLFKLGVKTLILTNAAGSLLRETVRVGNIVVADGFVTLWSPRMPLKAGEFCSPEDVLNAELGTMALEFGKGLGLGMYRGGYAMLLGPWFEGRKYDKPSLRDSGAAAVGMSTFPEACIAALYKEEGANVLAMSFITNDDVEEHSHEENVARGKASAAKMGALLEGVIACIP